MEHRWGKRVSIEVPVLLEGCPFERTQGHIANLSISGALIYAAIAPIPFTFIEVLVHGRSVPAWVVRREPGGFGVEWRELAPPEIGLLLRGCTHADAFAATEARAAADAPAAAVRYVA